MGVAVKARGEGNSGGGLLLALVVIAAFLCVSALSTVSNGVTASLLDGAFADVALSESEFTATGSYHIPGIGDVVTSAHATNKHGIDATLVRVAFGNGGPQWQEDCTKADRVLLGKLFTDANGIERFAFTVIGATSGRELTAFTVPSEQWRGFWKGAKERDGCGDRNGHDGSNGPLPAY